VSHETIEDPTGRGPGGLNATLGIRLLDPGEADGRAEFDVADVVRQPFGLVHGGAFSAIAETVASAMTHAAVADDGMVAMGQANSANFLRPVTEGRVRATGRVVHRGRTTWVWDVDCTDDAGRLAAAVRVVIAVRPAPNG